MKNFVIVKTGGNNTFSAKIARSIKWINEHYYPNEVFNTSVQVFNNIHLDGMNPKDTVIHVRAAYPKETGWIKELIEAEKKEYRVINKPSVLVLTANKLQCSLKLQHKVSHPLSWEYRPENDNLIDVISLMIRDLYHPDYIIAKPIASMEQGANVRKIKIVGKSTNAIEAELEQVPGKVILLQEYIPYIAIHRVIVIGGKALPYTFVDKPEWHPDNWKVSVCLNKTTMQYMGNPDAELIELAETTQHVIGGEINFIDVFETDKKYVISEINTACTLNIHEQLAKAANEPKWNIHYRIARYLVSQAMGE